jgi:actin-related protein 8
MVLNMGGNDITEFLYVLLERIGFPYRDADLAFWYDYNLIETLKAKLITLAEVIFFKPYSFHQFLLNMSQGDVGLNLYDFVVRRPGEPARKYGLKAYDEIILAPMVRHLYSPHV